MDGYQPIAIQSVTKETDNVFKIKTHHYWEGDEHLPSDLAIYIIDQKSKLAIWAYKWAGDMHYQLMVPKEHAKMYDIVALRSDISKQGEFDFETVDYKKLINSVKGTGR